MATGLELLPLALVAVMMTATAVPVTAVGVPLMLPVAASILSPAGRLA